MIKSSILFQKIMKATKKHEKNTLLFSFCLKIQQDINKMNLIS